MFFSVRKGPNYAAKAIYAECPVLNACMDWALDRPDLRFGIFGGMTAQQRNSERRRRRQARQVA